MKFIKDILEMVLGNRREIRAIKPGRGKKY
jgi:hypothetical protein